MSNEPRKLELSVTQVTASAVAAVVGAAASARLGTAGTFIGAGVVSAIATTGSAIFSHSLRRTKDRVQTVVHHHVDVAQESQATAQQIPMLQRDLVASEGGADDSLSTRDTSRSRALRWRPVVAVTMLVFALAVLGITAVEVVGGKSLHDIETGKQGSGTSLAHVVGGGSAGSTPDRSTGGTTPSPTPSSTGATPGPTSTPSAGASPSASPSASASTAPSPTPSASASPSGSSVGG